MLCCLKSWRLWRGGRGKSVSYADHRATLDYVFAETAKGNGRPFVEIMADDVRWEIIGTTSWSRAYIGKQVVLRELLAPLAANFDGPNIVSAETILVEGDTAVIEARNHSRTMRGEAYANRYCWIFRFSGDKVLHITEYADTDLIARALDRLT